MVRRTGPIGRLVRLGIAAIAAVALVTIADQGGPASFRDASNATEPVTWLLHGAMLFAFVMFTGQLGALVTGPDAVGRWQRRAVLGLAVALLAAAVATRARAGAVWDSPLVELVWLFDAVMLVETTLALLAATLLGTPGCEVGAWAELARRLGIAGAGSGGPRCPVGLHLIDDWEAQRTRARQRVAPDRDP